MANKLQVFIFILILAFLFTYQALKLLNYRLAYKPKVKIAEVIKTFIAYAMFGFLVYVL
ncbi:MAG: hypothetical protein ACE5KT_09705 [Methanosarcinales archaeon]